MAASLWWPLILAPLLPFTRAGPPSGSLTDHITSVAPKCSHSCILNFIHNNFPIQVCTPQNFNCLCINPTSTGYTLGEAALTCLYSTCDGEDSKNNAMYNICNGIPGAQSNSHLSLPASFLGPAAFDDQSSTLSNVVSSTSESTASTRTSSSRGTSSTKSLTSTSSQSISTGSVTSSKYTSSSSSSNSLSTTTRSTSSSSSDTSISTSSISDSSVAASSSATPAPAAASLSRSQIAGVVIASVGVGALAFGFCFFLICYRRRHKSKKQRHSDVSWGEKLPQSQDSDPDIDEPIARGGAQQASPPPESRPPLKVLTPSTNGWQNWTRNSNPHGIGLALAPDTRQEPQQQRGGPSPMTPYSQRTHSQLLPDRPHYSTIPPTARHSLNRQSRSLHVPIPAYRPDVTPPMSGPNFPSTIDTSQANLQGLQRSMSDPFYNEPRSPPMDYRGVPYTPFTNPAVRPRSIIRVEDTSSVIPRGVPPPTIPESSEIPPLPVAGLARLKSQRYPPRKKSASSSRYTRYSADSATSFEDIDEEQTPLRSAETPIDSYFISPDSQHEIPPLPIKSAKRGSHIINRPHPTRSQRRRKDVPELALDTQSRDVTQTAKWKILVSPGLQSLDESLPTTPKTPLMAGKTPPLPATDRLPRPAYRISDFR